MGMRWREIVRGIGLGLGYKAVDEGKGVCMGRYYGCVE